MEDEDEEEDPHLNALEEEEMYGDEDMEKATHEEEFNDEDLLQSEEETEELSNTEVLEILKQKKLQETKYEQARAEQQQVRSFFCPEIDQRREKEAEIKRIRKLNMKKAEEEMPYILPIPEKYSSECSVMNQCGCLYGAVDDLSRPRKGTRSSYSSLQQHFY